jgi:hypothetical protein
MSDIFTWLTLHALSMSVDDPSDERGRVERPCDDTSTGSDHDAGPIGDRDTAPVPDRDTAQDLVSDIRAAADRPGPTALRATGPALTIEFGRETGEIRIHRETLLGTYTESVER